MAVVNVSADQFANKDSDCLALSALNTLCREERVVVGILGSFVTALGCLAFVFLRH